MYKFLLFLTTLMIAGTACAKDYRVSLAIMPVYAESMEKGILVDFVKALAEEYKEGQIKIVAIAPFERSILNVEEDKADWHFPILKSPWVNEEDLLFRYSTTNIFEVPFLSYTHKKKPISPFELSHGYVISEYLLASFSSAQQKLSVYIGKHFAKAELVALVKDIFTSKNELNKFLNAAYIYHVETDLAHVGFFDIPMFPAMKLEAGIQKLALQRSDAFIFAGSVINPIIKNLKLTNIDSALYALFDTKGVLPKDEKKAKEIDELLTNLIAKLHASGKYHEVMKSVAEDTVLYKNNEK